MEYKNLLNLIETVRILRSPEGCKWDREQTHETLRRNMLEEAYEAVDAIDDGDTKHLREELGDVLLQVVLHSQIASENGEFNLDDVAKELNEKLIHRHPHVFGDVKVKNTEVAAIYLRTSIQRKVLPVTRYAADQSKQTAPSNRFDNTVKYFRFSKPEDERKSSPEMNINIHPAAKRRNIKVLVLKRALYFIYLTDLNCIRYLKICQ